jgi:hypothetical protein
MANSYKNYTSIPDEKLCEILQSVYEDNESLKTVRELLKKADLIEDREYLMYNSIGNSGEFRAFVFKGDLHDGLNPELPFWIYAGQYLMLEYKLVEENDDSCILKFNMKSMSKFKLKIQNFVEIKLVDCTEPIRNFPDLSLNNNSITVDLNKLYDESLPRYPEYIERATIQK